MKLHIVHRTVFTYQCAPQHAVQRLYMRPLSGATQTVAGWSIDAPGVLLGDHDGLGNAQDTFSHSACSETLSIVAQGWVDSHDVAVFDEPQGLSPHYFAAGSDLAQLHSRISVWAHQVVGAARADAQAVLALAQAVAERVVYRAGQTAVETEALEAFDWGAGVCQDQAHVLIAACRGLGWPARYVSGYFYDAQSPDLASHAWVDVCVDIARQRWLSVDVTHACWADARHVRLAVGRDYSQCSPTRGVRVGGGNERMDVGVAITPA